MGKIRRCAAPAPAREARNLHVERLMSVRTPLVACMKGQQADLRLVLNIAADGTIANLEVTTKTDEVAKVDLKVLQCVNHAVSGLTFPAGNGPVKLSTHLRASP